MTSGVVSPSQMPPADVDITTGLVARLLSEQHPDLVDLEIKWLANGWDNVLFRLGSDLAVRLPRRVMAAALVANELRWHLRMRHTIPIGGNHSPRDTWSLPSAWRCRVHGCPRRGSGRTRCMMHGRMHSR